MDLNNLNELKQNTFTQIGVLVIVALILYGLLSSLKKIVISFVKYLNFFYDKDLT